MVYFRREIFASKFRHVVEAEMSRRGSQKGHAPVDVRIEPWGKRWAEFVVKPKLGTVVEATHSSDSGEERGRSLAGRLRPDMIRRMDDAPKLINPSGFISEGHTPDPSAQGRSLSVDPPPSRSRTRSREPSPLAREEIENAARRVSLETDLELTRALSSEHESDDTIGREK